jgi:hypothetical protein
MFALEADHLVEIERRFPECAGKAYLLGCLAPDGRLEIDDPLNAPIDVLEDCFRRIDAARRPSGRARPPGGKRFDGLTVSEIWHRQRKQ